MRYLYGEVNPSLDLASDFALDQSPAFGKRFGPFDFSTTVSSLQGALLYDSRDNIFIPTRRIFSELDLTANLTALGATTDFQSVDWTGIWYRPLDSVRQRLVPTLRFDDSCALRPDTQGSFPSH